MKEMDIVIHNPTGLHARPAKIFVSTAKQFKSSIQVRYGDKKANAKSLISVLALGIKTGGNIQILIDGEDATAAEEALEAVIADGFGEGNLIAAEQPAAEPAPAASPTPEPAPAATPEGALRGVAAAPGVAIGPIFPWRPDQVTVSETYTDAATEKKRLDEAFAAARTQLGELVEQMIARGNAEEAAIFEVHQDLLGDEEMRASVDRAIEGGQSAAAAWQAVVAQQAAQMAALDDPVLAARAADIRDVGRRVLRLLAGAGEDGPALPDHPVILAAQDLAPSDTAALDVERVLGFVTAVGGSMSHSAIIARALNLPAVTGAGPEILDLAAGTPVILDGHTGLLHVDPTSERLAEAEAQRAAWSDRVRKARERAAEQAVTRDGRQIEIAANIGGAADARRAVQEGAEGVGLLRTEFLFLGRQEAPTEEEQFAVYKEIVEAMDGRPVILRTLDIGGDKPLPYIQVEPEENPFLGERGIRLCLNRPELLRTQLRAIYRAAAHGPLRIMFPMVTHVSDWRRARAMADEVRREVGAERVDLGIMVEVPAVALTADRFAGEIDFFSIGTNDLTQYTLAIDRGHPVMAQQFDGLHPAVLRLIGRTVEAAHAAGKWVGICGELGSDPQAIPLLVGLGLDELSVSPPAVPAVKEAVRRLATGEARDLADRALACDGPAEVRALVAEALAALETEKVETR